MTYNKIYAVIGEERHITLDPVNYQYDVKQILVISGETLPEYYEADICNVGDTATLTMIGTAADGVEIPDKFLLDGRNVLVYIVIPGSGGDVQTRYDITIPVDERAEREDIDPSEAEQQQIDSLIGALNDGVSRAETAAEAAEQAETEIETYVERAETAAGNAETSASNAAESASSASNSASTAATKASQAASSAQSASQDASAANASAGSAARSASSASASASAAAGSASNAAGSANSASASAGQALSSALSASGSASQAAGSAQSASGSATSASQSATSAANSASTATTKAQEAASKATEAGNAMDDAVTAKGAAETAQGKAEEAQEAAEEAQSAAEAVVGLMQPIATADDVGKALIVDAVDLQTGKPSSYKYGSSGWKKIYEYTATGLWDEIEVRDIDYETGVITLAPNDSPITDSFNGTCYSSVLIDALVDPRIKYGNMPVEMWGLTGGLYGFPKAVLVGENQIKLFNDASTSYDSFTYNENVDFSKFKVLARNKTSAPGSIRVNGLDLTKYKYKVCFDITRAGKCGLGVQYPGSTGNASYPSVQAMVNPADYNLTYTSQSNYETWSTRVFGGKGYDLLPKRFEAEIRPFGNGAVMDYTVNMLVFKTTGIGDIPRMWTLKDSVYFRTKETYIQFACGINYYLMAESAHIVAWEQEI